MIMSSMRALERIVAPVLEPVTLAEAKLYLRVDGNAEDVLVTSLISAARQCAEEFLQKSLMPQRWKLTFEDYAPVEIPLPRGPVQSIVSVKTISDTGAETTIATDQYRLSAAKDLLRLKTTLYAQRVEVVYDAGYADAASVPGPIKYGMLAHIATLFDQRGDAEETLPAQTYALYAPFREVRL